MQLQVTLCEYRCQRHLWLIRYAILYTLAVYLKVSGNYQAHVFILRTNRLRADVKKESIAASRSSYLTAVREKLK